MAIKRAVVYYACAALAFSVGIKCQHCTCETSVFLIISQSSQIMFANLAVALSHFFAPLVIYIATL